MVLNKIMLMYFFNFAFILKFIFHTINLSINFRFLSKDWQRLISPSNFRSISSKCFIISSFYNYSLQNTLYIYSSSKRKMSSFLNAPVIFYAYSTLQSGWIQTTLTSWSLHSKHLWKFSCNDSFKSVTIIIFLIIWILQL